MSLILPREPAAASTPKVPQAQVTAIELPSVQPDRYS
jgi:hypothetical protein